jgi:3-hydroxyacyl-CoA dehydrogenase
MVVLRRTEGRTGYVELDNPPVNAIGLKLREGLLEAVDWAESEHLERVVLSGRGNIFAAGGDAKEFDGPPVPPHLPDVLDRIECSRVPWIAAVRGAALGGGLELMLACRYRIVEHDTKLGLPEVTLGVVPGAGGTQRLPRLVGLQHALEMVSSGKNISAAQAKEIGLVDAVSANSIEDGETLNAELLSTCVPVRDLPAALLEEALLETTRATVGTKMKGQLAPLTAITLIEQSTRLPFEAGLKEERAKFLALRGSPQSKALRHVFFAERAAGSSAGTAGISVSPVSDSVVVGGGTMGAGIAYALLMSGMRVIVLETGADGIAHAQDNLDNLIEAGVKREVLSNEKAVSLRDGLTITDNFSAAAGASLAIEAAFESMDVKISVFQKLEAALPPEAVLATNTSYLDIDEIAESVGDPSRVLGLHFFAPAHIMRLLEIVKGRETSETALAVGFDIARKLRKVPVLAGVCDGFIGNRILARYREAADTLLMDGATPWEVDGAMVAFGYAMGPYEAQDLSGLDIAFANRRRQDATRDKERRYIPIADRLVDEGRLGRKTGAGWYRYPGGAGKVIDPLIEDIIRVEARFSGVTRREFSAAEIQHRLLYAMINEAADILHEGIASRAMDIDLVTVFGYGFPRWRGGLMHYADALGAETVLEALREFAAEDALAWQPSPVIVACASSKTSFSTWAQ